MRKGLTFLARRAVNRGLIQPIRKLRWSRKKNPFRFTGLNRSIFHLYPDQFIDKYIYTEGIYERRVLDFLDQMLPTGGVMLDIGANIGNHAIFLRNKFSQIHCFDPNPIAVERLAANIDLNGESDRIVVHPVGLGDEDSDLYFHVERGSNLGASHFVDLPDTRVRTQ